MNNRTFLFIVFFFLTALSGYYAVGQVAVPFRQRTSVFSPQVNVYSIKGDFVIIGNKNLTLFNYSDNSNNNDGPMVYVDVDNDPNTVNSSMAELVFSSENQADHECTRVVYAGLYWTGMAHIPQPGSPNTFNVPNPSTGSLLFLDKGVVLFKHAEADDYTTITANHFSHTNDIFFPTSGFQNMYAGYAEVTDYVREYGAGGYFVANIALREETRDVYGGWGMIVVYENPGMNQRDITIFDGYASVTWGGGITYEIPVSGFKTNPQGDINMKLGIMAGEGDRMAPGCHFDIRNHNNTQWVRLNHTLNTQNNFFNSSIYTGNNPRNPNHLNNYGVDLAMFYIDNPQNSIVTNNQTSTRFRYSTSQGGDLYIIFCIAMAVDSYSPEFETLQSISSINGNIVSPDTPLNIEPGQQFEVVVEVRNLGQEDIDDFIVEIPISYAATYISATTEYFEGITGTAPDLSFAGNEGAGGLLTWHIGTLPQQEVPNSLLARLTYVLEATTDCFLITNQQCDISADVNAFSSGVGASSNLTFSNAPAIQGYYDNGDCQEAPNQTPIVLSLVGSGEYAAQFCSDSDQNYDFEFCNPASGSFIFSEVASYFPAGSQFFDQIDPITGQPTQGANEFNSQTGFPLDSGENVFFAKPLDTGTCFWPFTISVGFLNVQNPPALTICYGQNVSLVHLTSGVGSIGQPVSLPAGLSAVFDANSILITGTPTQSGTFVYSIPLIGSCDGFFAEATIVIQDAVFGGQIGSDQTIGQEARPQPLTSIENGNGSGEIFYYWEMSTQGPNQGFSQIPNSFEITYHPQPLNETAWFRRVTVSNQNGLECYSLSNTIMIYVEDDLLIRVPEGFTPDGDFINDLWVIANLDEFYPENRVKVFNRYGSLVFEASPYQNDWDGTPNRGLTTTNRNNKLPTGVYFYLIWVAPNSTPLSGFVTIFY